MQTPHHCCCNRKAKCIKRRKTAYWRGNSILSTRNLDAHEQNSKWEPRGRKPYSLNTFGSRSGSGNFFVLMALSRANRRVGPMLHQHVAFKRWHMFWHVIILQAVADRIRKLHTLAGHLTTFVFFFFRVLNKDSLI